MAEIVNDRVVFDADDLKWFAEYFADVPWAVYVYGMDEVHTGQDPDLSDDDPANPPHTEESARRYATDIDEITARWQAERPSPFNPVVRAVVLHNGVPAEETAGA